MVVVALSTESTTCASRLVVDIGVVALGSDLRLALHGESVAVAFEVAARLARRDLCMGVVVAIIAVAVLPSHGAVGPVHILMSGLGSVRKRICLSRLYSPSCRIVTLGLSSRRGRRGSTTSGLSGRESGKSKEEKCRHDGGECGRDFHREVFLSPKGLLRRMWLRQNTESDECPSKFPSAFIQAWGWQ